MLDRIKLTLRELRCYHSSNELEAVIEKSQNSELSYLEFLDTLLKFEMKNRKRNRIKRYQKKANFPAVKTFDEFDLHFQTSITKREINEWLTFTWIDQRNNKILMGPPGVGKTHLSIATGLSAVHNGYKVLFRSMQDIMEDMIIAENKSEFDKLIKKILKFDLIIIDELGYLPLKPTYANRFFQLINHCYEYRSIMITSNKLFNEWGNFFGDQTIATAILDRLMHHCEAIVLNGDSYRMRNVENKVGYRNINQNNIENNN